MSAIDIASDPSSTVSMWFGQSDDSGAARVAKKDLSAKLLNPDQHGFAHFSAVPSPRIAYNVVGVALGDRRVRGRSTGELAIKVYVRMKFPRMLVPDSELVPREWAGVRIDVEQCGIIRTHTTEVADLIPNPMEPSGSIQPGSSIGSCACENSSTGTLGAILKNSAGRLYGLSCYHVLVKSCKHTNDPIVHPSLLDAPYRVIPIGLLSNGVNPEPDSMNSIDAGVVLLENVSVTPQMMYIGGPSGTGEASVGMTVQKFGRTTTYSSGTVTTSEGDFKVWSERFQAYLTFSDQIAIQSRDTNPFSAAGDSGALVLDGNRQAVGLLFAGGDTLSIANHFSRVLQALDLALVTADNG